MSIHNIIMSSSGIGGSTYMNSVSTDPWVSRLNILASPAGYPSYGAVAYSPVLDKFLLIGQNNYTVYLSSDRINWTAYANLPLTGNPQGVIWGNGKFVIYGSSGLILTSEDGINWTQQTSGTTQLLYCATWTGTKFVVGGAGSVILTSTDGVIWSISTVGSGNAFYKIAVSGNVIVIISNNLTDKIYRSTDDGISWNLVTGLTSQACGGVAWGDSKFILSISGGYVLTSADGLTWSTTTVDTTYTPTSGNIYRWGDWFILSIPTTTELGNLIYISANGTSSWELVDYGLMYHITGLAFSTTAAVAINGVQLITTENINTWIRLSSLLSANTGSVTSVAYSPELNTRINFSSAGVSGAQSFNGLDWTAKRIFQGTSVETGIHGLCWANGKFIATSTAGWVLTSVDGFSWTKGPRIGTSAKYDVCWSSALSLFILVGTADSSGGAATSPDGITWTNRALGGTGYSVTPSNSIVVATRTSGNVATSTDGTTWTTRATGVTSALYGSDYNGSLFVVVGDSGSIVTSPDGITWTVRTSGISTRLRAVIWAQKNWLAVGDSGTIISSPDGITWSQETSGTSTTLAGILYDGVRAMAFGFNTILTKP